jgi:hypothetical protein
MFGCLNFKYKVVKIIIIIMAFFIIDAFPNSLINSNVSLKWKQRKSKELGTLPGSQHFGVRRVCWSFGMGLGIMISDQSLTRTYTNQTTSWLMHSWNTFGARTKHRQTRIHKTHHSPNLREATTFPLIIYFVPNHGISIQMAFSQNSQNWDSRKFGGP